MWRWKVSPSVYFWNYAPITEVCRECSSTVYLKQLHPANKKWNEYNKYNNKFNTNAYKLWFTNTDNIRIIRKTLTTSNEARTKMVNKHSSKAYNAWTALQWKMLQIQFKQLSFLLQNKVFLQIISTGNYSNWYNLFCFKIWLLKINCLLFNWSCYPNLRLIVNET